MLVLLRALPTSGLGEFLRGSSPEARSPALSGMGTDMCVPWCVCGVGEVVVGMCGPMWRIRDVCMAWVCAVCGVYVHMWNGVCMGVWYGVCMCVYSVFVCICGVSSGVWYVVCTYGVGVVCVCL